MLGLLACVAAANAQEFPKPKGLSLERLYSYPIVNGRSPSSPVMSPDGKYIAFGWNQTGERRLDLWIMEYPSGNKRMLVDSSKFTNPPVQDDKRTQQEKDEDALYYGGITGATFSPDGKELLFTVRGRTYRCDLNGKYEALAEGGVNMSGVRYSPDGKYYTFMSGSNLARMDRATGKIKQLTFLNSPNQYLSNYEFSPDGKWIYLMWSDISRMGSHVMMDFSKDRATVVNISRMWHGEKSVDNQHAIIPAEGGIIKFLEGIPRYHWAESVAWAPDSSFVALGWNAEDFLTYNISILTPGDTKVRTTYTEKAPKNYIPDFRTVGWSRDSKRVYFTTDIFDGKFGYRSLMSMEPSGKDIKPVYKENHDIAAWMRPKNSDRIILVTQAESQLTAQITVQEPNGQRKTYKVVDGFSVPTQFDDAGLPLASDDGKSIATLASMRTQNPELYGVEPEVKRLTTSQLPEFSQIKWAKMEEVSFKGPDGATIKGLLIYDPNIDRTKKHPAFISNMYANSAKRSWAGYFENYAAMELGFVVLQIDFRASWGQGGEFNSGYYRSLGIIDADEAVAGKKFLVDTGMVNPDRVGIWGWSYGGFLTCMIQLTKPGVFDTGVAVASVTDWNSYNEWYTRRRLGMQKDDPKIYEQTSPIYHAAGLQGNLFLVHGMLDDNVLFQDAARLAQRLIDNGKYFDMFGYPRDDHSIGKNTSRPHVYSTIMRYLYKNLYRP